MKVAIVHNAYGKLSGEEIVIDNLVALLKERGISISRFSRSSTDIEKKRLGKISAFFSGIHNPFAKREFEIFLKEKRPDVVHVHNLYPLISPSILPVCKKLRIPVVMTVHNFRLACPNGLLLSRGVICHRCLGGREYWCIIRNCENDIFKSTGYALRTAAARVLRRYFDNVSHFICLSEFQKNILVNEGLPADRVSVMANPLSFDVKISPTPIYKRGNESENPENNTGSPIGPFGDDRGMDPPAFAGLRQQAHSGMTKSGFEESGGYVAYVGRVSKEKGILSLFAAARTCSDIPFVVAGSYATMPEARDMAGENIALLGALKPQALGALYKGARIFVLPSVWYEGFPTVLLEAMSYGLPVICSRIGGLPEIVEDNVTGLLYEPGNASALAECIQRLWCNPDLCKKLGDAGRKKLEEQYSPDRLMDQLLGIYRKVISEVGGRRSEVGSRRAEEKRLFYVQSSMFSLGA